MIKGIDNSRTSATRESFLIIPPSWKLGLFHSTPQLVPFPSSFSLVHAGKSEGFEYQVHCRMFRESSRFLERRAGIEPADTGFADQRVSHFATGAHVWGHL